MSDSYPPSTVIAFTLDDFELINAHRRILHNRQYSMTFDEQRDYADRLMLLLERGIKVNLRDIEGMVRNAE